MTDRFAEGSQHDVGKRNDLRSTHYLRRMTGEDSVNPVLYPQNIDVAKIHSEDQE